jgi:Flp pilus assembly protein TadD
MVSAGKILTAHEVMDMTSALVRPYVSVAQILTAMTQIAAERHQAGRSAAAKTMYMEVLTLDPRHSDALFLLGVLERQSGHLEEAKKRLCEAARWTVDRGAIEAELQIVKQLLGRRGKPTRSCGQTDCSAVPMMARA